MTNDYEKKHDISYEPYDNRKFYRLTNVIKIRINGKEYKTSDWSVAACNISDYAGSLAAKDEIAAEFEINFQGFAIKFEQKIKVLRVEREKKTLVAEYIDINPRNKEILTHFSKGLITGELQSFDDFIRHIDIPVTENYLNETFREELEEKKFYFRRSLSILFYIALGLAVFLYVFKLYYSNVHLMQINSAVVSGKTEIINSPSRGILSDIYVQEEQYIEEDTPLFRVLNTRIQGEIERKKNEILKNKAILKEKQTKLKLLEAKLINFKNDISLKLENQNKIIESIGEKIDLTNAELAAKTRLYEKRIIAKPEIDTLKKELIRLEQELSKINYEYFLTYSSYKNPENAINSMFIHASSDSGDLKAEIERTNDIISIEENELEYIKSTNIQNTVKAPFKAYLKEIYAFKGKYVDEKTPIVFLKDVSGQKLIEAYLTEAEALKLRLGLEVKVVIPSQSLKLKGTLVKLEKRHINSGNNPVVAVISPNNPELLGDISDGTPAKVAFVKNKFSR